MGTESPLRILANLRNLGDLRKRHVKKTSLSICQISQIDKSKRQDMSICDFGILMGAPLKILANLRNLGDLRKRQVKKTRVVYLSICKFQ